MMMDAGKVAWKKHLNKNLKKRKAADKMARATRRNQRRKGA